MSGMDKEGGSASAGGRGSPGSGKGVCSWAKVIQGPPRQPIWTSYKISEGEIEHLQQYFTKVLEFLKAMIEESR